LPALWAFSKKIKNKAPEFVRCFEGMVGDTGAARVANLFWGFVIVVLVFGTNPPLLMGSGIQLIDRRTPLFLRATARSLMLRGGADSIGKRSAEVLVELEETIKRLGTSMKAEFVEQCVQQATSESQESEKGQDFAQHNAEQSMMQEDAKSSPGGMWADEDVGDEALSSGALLMGCNRFGQLGCIREGPQDETCRTPRAAHAFEGKPVKLLAFGAQHTVAVVQEGAGEVVISFGANSFGQLGRTGRDTLPSPTHQNLPWAPVDLRGAWQRRKWRQVECGKAHTALVDTTGALILFGSNQHGA
jgi:hypothetical protein